MKYDASAASGKKSGHRNLVHGTETAKRIKKPRKRYLQSQLSGVSEKKMTFALWDLEKCFVDRIDCTGL